MSSKDLFIALVVAFFVALGALAARQSARRDPKFVRKPFLTEAEARVLAYLEEALPAHRVMAQVAMGALLKAEESDRKRSRSTHNRFAQKIVDFVGLERQRRSSGPDRAR